MSISIEQTVDALKTFALGPWGSKSDVVRRETEKVVAGLQPDAFAGAIGDWVRAHVQYMHDPIHAEIVPTPEWMMTQIVVRDHCRADGDDIAVLVAAMSLSIGLEAQFVVVGFKKPGAFEHVFTRVKEPTGLWVAVDPVAGKFDEIFKRVVDSRVFPIEEPST